MSLTMRQVFDLYRIMNKRLVEDRRVEMLFYAKIHGMNIELPSHDETEKVSFDKKTSDMLEKRGLELAKNGRQ